MRILTMIHPSAEQGGDWFDVSRTTHYKLQKTCQAHQANPRVSPGWLLTVVLAFQNLRSRTWIYEHRGRDA